MIVPEFTVLLKPELDPIKQGVWAKTVLWELKVDPPLPLSVLCFGIDPGQVNAGFAVLKNDRAAIYQIKLAYNVNTTSRILDTAIMLDYLLSFWTFPRCEISAIVEGASHSELYGQVALAEVRTTAVIQLIRNNILPEVVPPGTIKKAIFGNGHARAGDFWPHLRIPDPDEPKTLRDDAAAALSMALFAYHLYELKTQSD